MNNRSKKFTEQLLCIGSWIQQRKKFLFLSPDYVVVGLSMKDYLKHFPSKDEVEKKRMIFIDEARDIDNDTFEKIKKFYDRSQG